MLKLKGKRKYIIIAVLIQTAMLTLKLGGVITYSFLLVLTPFLLFAAVCAAMIIWDKILDAIAKFLG